MNGLLVFLGVAMALLLALLIAAPWRREALPSGRSPELPDRVLMNRILAEEDAAFVESLGSPRIRRYFVRERRRLALSWLRQLYGAARDLRRQHVQLARHSSDVRLGAEARLACEFGAFLIAYAFFVAFVRWIGPFRGRRVLGAADSLVSTLDRLGRRIAASASAPERGVAAA